MSKAVMISVNPKWCEKIARGEKTIEVRKNRPKLETPFKCYIYCTYGKGLIEMNDSCYPNMLLDQTVSRDKTWGNCCNGKVIGEFTCDKIIETVPWRVKGKTGFLAKQTEAEASLLECSCLTIEELERYAGGENRCIYGWHISNLVIYDKPFELRQFVTEGDCDCMNCKKCFWFDRGTGYNVEADCNLVYEYLGTGKTVKPLFRPPQSWCYVEEVQSDG